MIPCPSLFLFLFLFLDDPEKQEEMTVSLDFNLTTVMTHVKEWRVQGVYSLVVLRDQRRICSQVEALEETHSQRLPVHCHCPKSRQAFGSEREEKEYGILTEDGNSLRGYGRSQRQSMTRQRI
jgi:hypothetical protein